MDDRDPVVVAAHGATRVITMNRPGARNAIDVPMRERLLTELRRADGDPDVRAIVLTGAGGTFSAGGDIRSMEGVGPGDVKARLAPVHRAVRLIATCGTPVIAAVEAALELAAEAAALAPLSVAATKRLLARNDPSLKRLLEAEREEQAALFGSADFAEGRAAFAERRPPRFEGR